MARRVGIVVICLLCVVCAMKADNCIYETTGACAGHTNDCYTILQPTAFVVIKAPGTYNFVGTDCQGGLGYINGIFIDEGCSGTVTVSVKNPEMEGNWGASYVDVIDLSADSTSVVGDIYVADWVNNIYAAHMDGTMRTGGDVLGDVLISFDVEGDVLVGGDISGAVSIGGEVGGSVQVGKLTGAFAAADIAGDFTVDAGGQQVIDDDLLVDPGPGDLIGVLSVGGDIGGNLTVDGRIFGSVSVWDNIDGSVQFYRLNYPGSIEVVGDVAGDIDGYRTGGGAEFIVGGSVRGDIEIDFMFCHFQIWSDVLGCFHADQMNYPGRMEVVGTLVGPTAVGNFVGGFIWATCLGDVSIGSCGMGVLAPANTGTIECVLPYENTMEFCGVFDADDVIFRYGVAQTGLIHAYSDLSGWVGQLYYTNSPFDGELRVDGDMAADVWVGALNGSIDCGSISGTINCYGSIRGTVTVVGDVSGAIDCTGYLWDDSADATSGHVIVNGSFLDGAWMYFHDGMLGNRPFVTIDYDANDSATAWDPGAYVRLGDDYYYGNTPLEYLFDTTCLPGDCDNSNLLNNGDISPFIEAYFYPEDYKIDYAGIGSDGAILVHADLNGDGFINAQDLDQFVYCLYHPSECPCETELRGRGEQNQLNGQGEGDDSGYTPEAVAATLQQYVSSEHMADLIAAAAELAAGEDDQGEFWTGVLAGLE